MYIPSTWRGRGAPPKMTTRVADNGGSIIFEDVNDNEGIRRINMLHNEGEFGPDALHTSEDYTADLNRMFKEVNGKSFSDLWQEDPKQAITALENFLSAEKILIENLGDIYDGTKRIHLREGLLVEAEEEKEDVEKSKARLEKVRNDPSGGTAAIEAKKQAIYEAGWPYKIDKIIVDDGKIVAGLTTANTQNAYDASIEWNKSLRRKRPKSAAKVPGKKKTTIGTRPFGWRSKYHKIKSGGRRRKTARKYKRKKRKSYRKRKTRRRTRKKTRRRRRRK